MEESKSVVPQLRQQVANDLSSNKKKKKEKTVSLDEFMSGNLDNDVKIPVEANGSLSACKKIQSIINSQYKFASTSHNRCTVS